MQPALWSDDTRLALNMAYTNRRTKFRIVQPLSAYKGSGGARGEERIESDAVNSTVAQDRRHYIECVIVRVMKMCKVIMHNALVQEVST